MNRTSKSLSRMENPLSSQCKNQTLPTIINCAANAPDLVNCAANAPAPVNCAANADAPNNCAANALDLVNCAANGHMGKKCQIRPFARVRWEAT